MQSFQKQDAIVIEVVGNIIHLDRKVKCENFHDWNIKQTVVTAHPKQMQTIVADAWATFWGENREGARVDKWDDALLSISWLWWNGLVG